MKTQFDYTTIKTFEDACNKLGHNHETILPDLSMFPEKHRKALIAIAMLFIIAEALNDGWEPDWSNVNWDKYYPYFHFNDASAVGGLSYCAHDYVGSNSSVGSRICYKSSDIAEYAGEQFLDLYRDYMTYFKG